MINTLQDDNHCFVCGEKNQVGLHLKFSIREGKIHQGYKDIVHGGIISTIIDEAMVKAAIMQGIPAVTAEITVRFKKTLRVGEKVLIEATIINMNKKIIETSAHVKKADDTIIAEGHAKLLRQD
jgi:uncharacterized protein (TIGR00369 family)